MSEKEFPELIGEAAQRTGLMNRFQVGAVLHYQQLVQKPIGECLVEGGYLSKPLTDTYLRNFQNYNEQFISKR